MSMHKKVQFGLAAGFPAHTHITVDEVFISCFGYNSEEVCMRDHNFGDHCLSTQPDCESQDQFFQELLEEDAVEVAAWD